MQIGIFASAGMLIFSPDKNAFRFEMCFFIYLRFPSLHPVQKGKIFMTIYQTVSEIKEFSARCRKEGKSIGLVPTMGALHEGHASLIKKAAEENDVVIVSVFVNPTQFAPNEDFDAYPRQLKEDAKKAEEAGATVIFAPAPKEMYPSSDMTWVEVTGDITKVLCGKTRPTHFRGVTTVVSKLFNLTMPDRAYFGQKDAQQVEVLRRMVKDLFFNVELRILPIVREEDGLAKSSRNIYLSDAERKAALVLSKSLIHAKELVLQGENRGDILIQKVREDIEAEPLADIDYIEIYGLPGLVPVTSPLTGRNLLALAVRFGTTRLIDNIVLEVK